MFQEKISNSPTPLPLFAYVRVFFSFTDVIIYTKLQSYINKMPQDRTHWVWMERVVFRIIRWCVTTTWVHSSFEAPTMYPQPRIFLGSVLSWVWFLYLSYDVTFLSDGQLYQSLNILNTGACSCTVYFKNWLYSLR